MNASSVRRSFRVVCVSTAPMIQDDFSRIPYIPGGDIPRAFAMMTRRHRAYYTLYEGPKGETGFRFEMLHAAIRDALFQLEWHTENVEMSCPYQEFIPFDRERLHPDWEHPTEPKKNILHGWVPDVRMTRDGTRSTRAKFPTWGFTVTCTTTDVPDAEPRLKTLFDAAGKLGLGAYRPPRGPFGTFAVLEINRSPP